VGSTAAATLQQLVISLFEKLESEDSRSVEVPTVAEAPKEDGTVFVRPVANDALKIFSDLCSLAEGGKLQYVRFAPIPLPSALELVESILSNCADVFRAHPEQANILRTKLLPFVVRSLSERLSFPVTLRIFRILSVVLRHHLTILQSECELALGLLNHMLDPESSPSWKRALCMEIFRLIYAEPDLVLEIHSLYDEQATSKPILRDNLSAFVRLATEKPVLIGIGQQSTAPAGNAGQRDGPDQAAIEAGAVAGLIGGGSMDVSTANVPGISTLWSSPRTACLDQLDKAEPSQFPETYIYSLVLTCLNSLSESLARLVLPLTVQHEGRSRKQRGKTDANPEQGPEEEFLTTPNGKSEPTQGANELSRSHSYRKRTIPVNPLTLENHPAYAGIKIIAALIDDCWPAVLASCSTFLYAALDADYYRSLVRAFQKFTQVAGLLRMTTPRDAFLTTLGKAAVPVNVRTAGFISPTATPVETPGLFSNAKGLLGVDAFAAQPLNLNRGRRTSVDMTTPSLTTRNLLCLRALLNLAIALGSTLENAWLIILEPLRQADILMASWTSRNKQGIDQSTAQTLSSEVSAAMLAADRLFESTVDFPNEAFLQMLTALCKLLHDREPQAAESRTPITPSGSLRHERRAASSSSISLSTEAHEQDYKSALKRIGSLAHLNMSRLLKYDASEGGWDILINELSAFVCSDEIAPTARQAAANTLSGFVKDAVTSDFTESQEQRNDVQCRAFHALLNEVKGLRKEGDVTKRHYSPRDGDPRIHLDALSALQATIEQAGDALTAGWNIVLELLLTAFERSDLNVALPGKSSTPSDPVDVQFVSISLGRTAYDTVQLICSDFLSSIPNDCFIDIINLLFRFCKQTDDLNISLTVCRVVCVWQVEILTGHRLLLSSGMFRTFYMGDSQPIRSMILRRRPSMTMAPCYIGLTKPQTMPRRQLFGCGYSFD